MLLICLIAPTYALAQAPKTWGAQAPIPDYDINTEEPPFLVADQANNVYAFNSQSLDDSGKLIVYRQWSEEQGWSQPNDIFASSQNDIELLGLFMDHDFVVHLVMCMGGNIYYSQAPLVNAGTAQAWSTPALVGDQAQSPVGATIVGDNKDTLVILYAGVADSIGLYMVKSVDNGIAWSSSEAMFHASGSELTVAGINAIFTQTGLLHVVWNEFDRRGVGVSGYYANYGLVQGQFANTRELDEGGLELGIKFATIFEYQDNLIVTYYNGKTNGHYWRVSKDDGQTWSDPVRVTPDHIGTNGPVSYAVDSNNVLHLFFGERIDDNNHGVWHLTWNGNGWTGLESVVRGPHVADIPGGKGFDPHSAKGIVVNGNLLFVAWGTDGASGVNGAWYSFKHIDTPALPTNKLSAIPLPIQALIPIPVPPLTSVATSVPTPFAKAVIPLSDNVSLKRSTTGQILFTSIAPSLLVIGITFLIVAASIRRP